MKIEILDSLDRDHMTIEETLAALYGQAEVYAVCVEKGLKSLAEIGCFVVEGPTFETATSKERHQAIDQILEITAPLEEIAGKHGLKVFYDMPDHPEGIAQSVYFYKDPFVIDILDRTLQQFSPGSRLRDYILGKLFGYDDASIAWFTDHAYKNEKDYDLQAA